MKIPVSFLKDYVNIDMDAKKLGDLLTLSGSKVEEVITSGDEIQNVVTGKILKIEPHPDADKLVICQVEVGKDEPIQIVTGAANMKENDIVPVALHGSSLIGGVKIKKGKLRGIPSNGMMCSEEELGLADEGTVHGLMILPENTVVGKNIKEVLDLDNAVIDFEITSNRPDCLSIVGMARETAATLNTNYKMPALDYKIKCKENINNEIKVEIKDTLCKRYVARGVKNIKIADSPSWMAEKLLQAGVRPINNIVDITNFVMIELGQPLHAYDRRVIASNTIVVERAKKDESFVTLDEQERKLSANILTIKDGHKTIGIAGIMGGLNSEIKDDTTEIIFESANFDGTNVRVSSKELNLRTEASGRFEKDLDPCLSETAMNRACNLIEELNAGEIMEGTIDIYENPVKEHSVEVDSNWINKFLGINITKDQMKSYLDRLELTTEISGDNLIVNVPTFRGDINIREDVAEEIVRIYGYNKVESTDLRVSSVRTGRYKNQVIKNMVVDTLIASGLSEAICYSFVSPKVFDKILLPKDSKLRKAVTIRNPLGEDYSIMRTTTIPSMMEAFSRNYSRNNEIVRLFEIGKNYVPSGVSGEIPKEKNMVTIGIYGNIDYLDLKGIVENVFETLDIKNISYERESENVSYHPGKTATAKLNKKTVATLGQIHPDVASGYGINEECYVAEIDLDALINNAIIERKYKALPKFPAVTRDMAILVDDCILVQQIDDVIKRHGGNIVENFKLFDVYKGTQIPEGKKSIAYSITYRNENKTLTDKEVEKVHNKILSTLEYTLGAKLR